MQKAVLFFIVCVLLCEVSPKVPIRKEDLLNKKAAYSKQLSPSVPKWEDLASKLHTKDKPTQNKSKTMLNLLKVVSAKEIEVPGTNFVKNDTIINSTLNINETNNQNLKNNEAVQNNTNQNYSIRNNIHKNNLLRRIKPNAQTNATVAKTPKKYAANETIGAKLAFFLLKNAFNSTKEKADTPEIIAPTMIPIFKPMPSSTKKTIPQPLANELIRKDNFVPKELNPQQLKNLDNIELNPNVFNPLHNKAVLNPLIASEDVPKDILHKDVNLNVESKERIEQGLKPVIYSNMQNAYDPEIRTASETTNSHTSDITLNYIDPQSTHGFFNKKQITENTVSPVPNDPANIANIQLAQKTENLPVEGSNPTINGAFTNQINYENFKLQSHHPIQNNGPQYELNISPPLPRDEDTNNHARTIQNGNLPVGLNPQFIQKQLNTYEKMLSTPGQHEALTNQNNFADNQNNLANHHSFGVNNDFVVNQKDFAINPSILQANQKQHYQNQIDLAHQHGLPVNQNNFKMNKNDFTVTKNSVNANTNTGAILNPDMKTRVVSGHGNLNSQPKAAGFNLPCLKASDVLEDFVTAPNCCKQNKPISNTFTENPIQNSQCEKPILVDGDKDEDVAIVFKPKNISLLKFYGDLLKKITLTVLVPYHISKLTSQ